MKQTLLFIFLFLSLESVIAQVNNKNENTIHLLGKVNENSIELRWAPSDPISWELLNKYGYQLERITTYRKGKLLESTEKIMLWTDKVKPEQEWSKVYQNDTTDKYIPIAAQALFGENFSISTMNQSSSDSELMQIINQVKEREARFTYALFSADQSMRVSKLSALSFEDKNIKKGERYLYRIHSLVPDSIHSIKHGKVQLGLHDYKPLPEPWRVNASYKEGRTTISWDWLMLSEIYTSYWVQRAETNQENFKDLMSSAFVQPSINNPSPNMVFIDTLGNREGTFWYRVKGKDAFGKWGPYSKPMRVEVYPEMKYIPELEAKEDNRTGSVLLSWDVDTLKTIGVDHFKIIRGETDQQFDTLKGIFPPISGSFIDLGPNASNYYKLGAVNKKGKINWSLVSFVQLEDSIPPSIPIELAGRIDSLGNVQISWKKNNESDFFGYRVYRSNKPNDQFHQLTKKEIFDNHFEDKVSLKVLNKKIYYKIMAIDKRGNPSQLSDPLIVNRPDIIPPSPPVITQTKNTSKGPQFHWLPSASKDVAFHLIYRKEQNIENSWELIFEAEKVENEQVFIDSTVVNYDHYYYLMVAVDESDLESVPTKPIGLHKLDSKIRAGVDNVSIKRLENSLLINWTLPPFQCKSIDIYRTHNDGPLRHFKRETKNLTQSEDKNVKDGELYMYRIRVNYEDGTTSEFSKQITYKF